MKNLKVTAINGQGELAGEETLNVMSVVLKNSDALWAQAVRVFLANQRRARAKTKTRAEVRGSGIKIWRQKGTGRARHGARQAPIFVGGGVVYGPTGTQNYKEKLNRKSRQKTLLSILQEKIKTKKFYLAKELNFKKTKEAFAFTQKVLKTLSPKGKVAFLLSKDDSAKKYLRNFPKIAVLNTESLNPYFLLQNEILLVSEAGLKNLERQFSIKEANVHKN